MAQALATQPRAASRQTEMPSPQQQLLQIATAYWASRTLHFAAQMGLPDRLADAPKTADELAQEAASDPRSLYRVMRTLAGMGIFTEDASHRFALTPMGEALRTGTPGSVRSAVLTLAGLCAKALDELPYSVETGKPGFEKVFGLPCFDWLAKHPAEASMVSETMVGFHGTEPAAVAAAYDYSQFDTVVDVGCATGNLLAAVLGHHAKPRGSSLICRMSFEMRRRCSRRTDWRIASPSHQVASSTAFPPPMASICCRISSTTGPRPSV